MNMDFKISIREVGLPESINGLCSQCSDDEYIILLREDLPEPEKEKAFVHEMMHIYHGDFAKQAAVDDIEKDAHCRV